MKLVTVPGAPAMLQQQPTGELLPPIFHCVTKRDGNQALKRPWNLEQKMVVFGLQQRLGIKRVELGYPGASEMDFDAVAALAESAPDDMVVTALARANETDIRAAGNAFQLTRDATPMIHTFIGMSPYHMSEVLHKTPDQVRRMAVAAVGMAKSYVGSRGLVQFSPEHFGDCLENLDWVIEVFQEMVGLGVNVINLPNTVERYRPAVFAAMVSKVRQALPSSVVVSAHCHNDLGMGTATTVEAYFAGAQQVEVTDNGLGERAGNTNMYEVAVALECNGVPTGLNLELIYETALKIAELSGVPIPEKAPLIGSDCFTQRSGIHQHGAVQTFNQAKRAYLPCDPQLIGRAGAEQLEFTSQSGTAAVEVIVRETGRNIAKEDARLLQPALKLVSEQRGALTPDELAVAYDALKDLRQRHTTELQQADINAVVRDAIGLRGKQTWVCKHAFAQVGGPVKTAAVVLIHDGVELPAQSACGEGGVEAAYKAIELVTGLEVVVKHFDVTNVTSGANAPGEAVCVLSLEGRQCEGRGVDTDVIMAAVKAYMQALNRLVRGEANGVTH